MQHSSTDAAQPPDLLWNLLNLECVLLQSSDCGDKVVTGSKSIVVNFSIGEVEEEKQQISLGKCEERV
jgi:hypothetical protein